ncbi:MAG: hypothetical protein OXC27_08780 [Caldilineaceae bacterium]|nr:hypothetical protein [Caldilineaceae bacterium]
MATLDQEPRATRFCRKAEQWFQQFCRVLFTLFLLGTILPPAPAEAQEASPTYTISECEQVEEELLLSDLNRITRSVLERDKSGLDLAKIVEENWTELDLDSVVDKAVDEATQRVREERGTLDRIFSGWSEEKAAEFAEAIANQAFDSPEFRTAVDSLSSAIVDDLTVEIHLMTVKSASSAFLCVQEFIGAKFSDVMSEVLEDSTKAWLESLELGNIEGETDFVDLGDRTLSLVGIGAIVGTQIANVIARRVAQGILGKVVTRILGRAASAAVPVAGWVIGGALIIYDVYQAWEGSLPQIQDDLKSENVKETIRKEIVLVVDQELANSMPGISQSVTIEIYRRWRSFLQDFEHVLRLAESNEEFRLILEDVTPDQVDKLSELVEVTVDVLGNEWLNRLISSGEFKLIFDLPRASFKILRDTADPGLVLKWAQFADVRIVGVVETELYKYASPEMVGDRETLEKILALEDSLLIKDTMQKGVDERKALLGLPTAQTKWILSELSSPQSDWVISYLLDLPSSSHGRLVDFLVRDRGLISVLQESEGLQAQFAAVLSLAGDFNEISSILVETPAAEVEKLSLLVNAASEALDAEKLTDMIESGQFKEMLPLPQKAYEILRESGSPTVVLAWAELAGDAIVQVVEKGLHIVSVPEDFSGLEELERVLEIEHVVAIQRLMAMDPKERESLLQLPAEEARSALLSDLSDDDLSWLASYLPDLSPSARTIFASKITKTPELVPVLRASEDLGQKFKRVLELAANLLAFETILDNANPKDVAILSDLVVIAVDTLAPDSLPEFFDSGRFARLLSLPMEAFKILEWSGQPEVVIEWGQLAGDAIVEVAETELYKEADPDQFRNREELDEALALVGSETLTWLIQLEPKTRESVFSLDADPEIHWLHEYSFDLEEESTEMVAHSLDQNPAMLAELDKESVGQSVKGSKNIEQALAFVSVRSAEPQAWWPNALMLSGAIDVSSGNQPWQLYWHYHQTQSIILLGALLLLVALTLSVVWLGRRQRLPKIREYMSRLLGGQA